MELSCFGWTGLSSGGGGGVITGGGTPYTLAMFTPIGTSIGDSMAVQSSADIVPTPSVVLGSGSWTVGRDNIIAGNINLAVGYDLESYIYGDMMFGTTIHVDPTSTGNFNYWLGGNFTVQGNCSQNIANLYNSSIDGSAQSILYGHANTITNSNLDILIGHNNLLFNSASNTIAGIQNDVKSSSFVKIIGDRNSINNLTVGGAFGYLNKINFSATLSYSYVIGFNNNNANNSCFLYGLGLTSDADNELQFGVQNDTKYVVRDNNFEWEFNGLKDYENKTSANTVTYDKNQILPSTATLQKIVIPTDTVVLIESFVTCEVIDAVAIGNIGEGNGYIRTVKATNKGGVVTIGVVQSSFTSETIAGCVVTFTPSGAFVNLEVTGVIENDIQWSTITNLYSRKN